MAGFYNEGLLLTNVTCDDLSAAYNGHIIINSLQGDEIYPVNNKNELCDIIVNQVKNFDKELYLNYKSCYDDKERPGVTDISGNPEWAGIRIYRGHKHEDFPDSFIRWEEEHDRFYWGYADADSSALCKFQLMFNNMPEDAIFLGSAYVNGRIFAGNYKGKLYPVSTMSVNMKHGSPVFWDQELGVLRTPEENYEVSELITFNQSDLRNDIFIRYVQPFADLISLSNIKIFDENKTTIQPDYISFLRNKIKVQLKSLVPHNNIQYWTFLRFLSTRSYEYEFEFDEIGNKLKINHNLGEKYVCTFVSNNFSRVKEKFVPSKVELIDENSLYVRLPSLADEEGIYRILVDAGTPPTSSEYFHAVGEFGVDDLNIDGNYLFEHNLEVDNGGYVIHTVYDQNDEEVTPTDITIIDENNILLDLTNMTVSGTWKIVVIKPYVEMVVDPPDLFVPFSETPACLTGDDLRYITDIDVGDLFILADH